MFASVVGRTFLKEYNRLNHSELTAKEFFDEIQFKLFYDHPQYLQWVQNSPFVQSIRKGSFPDEEERATKLKALHDKINKEPPDASFAIGFPARGVVETTSGQVSTIPLTYQAEDIYYSWIGAGLGVKVQGGLSLLFNDPEILMAIFQGWKNYRTKILHTPNMKGNQIETWNGQWLAHYYSGECFDDLFMSSEIILEAKNSIVMVKTQSWPKILFSLATNFPNSILTAYIYNLGQTNTTIGFIPLFLPEVRKLSDIYKMLFGSSDYAINRTIIETIFCEVDSLEYACERGAIGLRSLEPRGLKKTYSELNSNPFIHFFANINKVHLITYKSYISWVTAMLNNEELCTKAEELAGLLISFSEQSHQDRAKTEKTNLVKTILSSTNRKKFIESLTPFVAYSKSATTLNEIVEISTKMQVEQFQLFLVLLKFKFAYLNSNSNGD